MQTYSLLSAEAAELEAAAPAARAGNTARAMALWRRAAERVGCDVNTIQPAPCRWPFGVAFVAEPLIFANPS